jgi:hypothetical protein
MEPDERELLQKAQENAHWMFTEVEIAVMCNVPQPVVRRVMADRRGPFFMNLCRPEWFAEWMRRHPDFELSDEQSARTGPIRLTENSSGSNPWAVARRAPGGQRER